MTEMKFFITCISVNQQIIIELLWQARVCNNESQTVSYFPGV